MGRVARIAVLTLGLAGCGGESSSGHVAADEGSGGQPGTEGSACYPNGTCNSGLACFSNLCVVPPEAGASSGAEGSACYPNGTCNSGLECRSDRCVATASGGGGSGAGGALGGAGSVFGGGSPGTGGGSGGQSLDGGSSTGTGGSPGTGGSSGGGTCVGEARVVIPEPVDVYVMLDQSSSLGDALPGGGGTWWAAAQGALKTFIDGAVAAGTDLSMGIQYFPLNGVAPASCNASYSTPEVEIAPLAANAAALVSSIQAHAPSTFTPTGPALAGAIAHMKAWGPAHPGHVPVVALVTDGFPTECAPQQIADVAALARDAFETSPSVRTYVIGFETSAGLENLQEISKKGGGEATLISGGDIGAQVSDAMFRMASGALQCDLALPESADPARPVDLDRVSVTYAPSATNVEEEVPRLNAQGDCASNAGKGWFYDSPADPHRIVLCPGTCALLPQGTLHTVTGCAPLRGVTQ